MHARQLSSASRQQQQQKAHHVHTTSSERTFSEDLPLVPGRWAHIVNKLDEWVYFFTDVFWKSLGAFLSTILNWFRGGTSKKNRGSATKSASEFEAHTERKFESELTSHVATIDWKNAYVYERFGCWVFDATVSPLDKCRSAKAPATQIKIPAVNAKKYSGKDQKDNFGLDNRAILNPYLGCFGGAGDRAPGFRRAIVPEEDPFAHTNSCPASGVRRRTFYQTRKIVATGGWDGTIRSWRWNPNVGLSGGLFVGPYRPRRVSLHC